MRLLVPTALKAVNLKSQRKGLLDRIYYSGHEKQGSYTVSNR